MTPPPPKIRQFLQAGGPLSASAGYSHMLYAHSCRCTGALVFLGRHLFFLAVCCHFSKSDSTSLACVLSITVLTNLSGRGCPHFDSLLSSRVWIRIKLKSLPKTLCCFQYVCMHLIALNFECLVLQVVFLTATLQQEGNAFLSFLEIRCWHMKAEICSWSLRSLLKCSFIPLLQGFRTQGALAVFVPAQTTLCVPYVSS